MIAVFIKDDEIIIMEANEMGQPIDPKGLFFGVDGRHVSDYKRTDVDTRSGVAMRIKPTSNLVATITM